MLQNLSTIAQLDSTSNSLNFKQSLYYPVSSRLSKSTCSDGIHVNALNRFSSDIHGRGAIGCTAPAKNVNILGDLKFIDPNRGRIFRKRQNGPWTFGVSLTR